MLTIETKVLNISEELKKKVDMICKFAYAKTTYKNSNIRNIKGNNIAYVKPHIITINQIDYLMFDECDDIYINVYEQNYEIDKDYDDKDIDI